MRSPPSLRRRRRYRTKALRRPDIARERMTAPGRIRAVTLPIVGKTALAGLAAPAFLPAALGEAAAMQREQLQHLVGRFCGTEQIALHLGAAERTEQALLLL